MIVLCIIKNAYGISTLR